MNIPQHGEPLEVAESGSGIGIRGHLSALDFVRCARFAEYDLAEITEQMRKSFERYRVRLLPPEFYGGLGEYEGYAWIIDPVREGKSTRGSFWVTVAGSWI